MPFRKVLDNLMVLDDYAVTPWVLCSFFSTSPSGCKTYRESYPLPIPVSLLAHL